MFLHLSVSHSVHGGGGGGVCLSACWDTPLGRHLPAQCMLGYTPLPSACWDRHGYCCGRYAS